MVLLTRALGKEKQKENNLEVGGAEIGFGRSLLHIELTDNYVRCSVYGRSRTLDMNETLVYCLNPDFDIFMNHL